MVTQCVALIVACSGLAATLWWYTNGAEPATAGASRFFATPPPSPPGAARLATLPPSPAFVAEDVLHPWPPLPPSPPPPPPPPPHHGDDSLLLQRFTSPPPPPYTKPPAPPPPAPDAECYASRYPDLLAGFCGGVISDCDLERLALHFEEHGRAEGRTFACTVKPPSPPAPRPPPSPPSPPPAISPPPPFPPLVLGVRAINDAFRAGLASNRLSEIGLIMHQWDGEESESQPWVACMENCITQGQRLHGRLSSMIIYQALRKRKDRVAIPIPFGERGGLLISPQVATVDCIYGRDAATMNVNSMPLPGCTGRWCDPANPIKNGVQVCGFENMGAAWKLENMKQALELYEEYGDGYLATGFNSGYNEVIVNSKAFNDALPQAVQAFFVPANRGYAEERSRVACWHQKFVRKYGDIGVELLAFDPGNWNEPFRVYRPSGAELRQGGCG